MKITKITWMHLAWCGLAAMSALSSTGCQITEGGQTLPSPYYLEDDVQYYAPDHEFKLSREAQYLESLRATQELQRAGRRP